MNFKILTTCLLCLALDVHAISTTEIAIDAAREQLLKSPEKVELHISLAQLLAKRGRETARHDYYEQSLEAAKTALKIDASNIGAERAAIWALLGKHEFAEAKLRAVALNKRAPDDILTYALLVDAHMELGDYLAAEDAAQWLLDMRPGGLAGLTRAAYLRELFGDLEGSIMLLSQAIENSPRTDPEQQAWLLVHLAQLQTQLGRIDIAESLLGHALNTYPEYHYALRAMVEVALAKGEIDNAVNRAQHFYQRAPHPENLFVLARVLAHAGKKELASHAFSSFKKDALAESDSWDNANRELVNYFVDEIDDPATALRIAEQEHQRRQDIFTKDAYAWALNASGQTSLAWAVISDALSIGTKSPQILLHAGIIAHHFGKSTEARQYLSDALRIAPWQPLATDARKVLSLLEKKHSNPIASTSE